MKSRGAQMVPMAHGTTRKELRSRVWWATLYRRHFSISVARTEVGYRWASLYHYQYDLFIPILLGAQLSCTTPNPCHTMAPIPLRGLACQQGPTISMIGKFGCLRG